MRWATEMGQGAKGTGQGGNFWSFMATVGGLGYAPVAPGTWGSIAGLALGVVIVHYLRQPVSWMVLAVSWVASAAICTQAEQALDRHDPPSVILDEVLGMASVPVILPEVVAEWSLLIIALALFRVFDIIKPFPLKRLATLPVGWGIVADDAGAAAYTCLVLWIVSRVIQ